MSRRTARWSGALALVSMVGGATVVSCAPPAKASTLTRPDDPVVLTGTQLNALVGTVPDRIVGFATAGDSGWTQIPVQVDERLDTRMTKVYDMPATTSFYGARIDVPATDVYADPDTFVGADPDPTLDTDDEIVFMSRDTGGQIGTRARPAGTSGGGVEVKVADPTAPTTAGYVYLFPSDGSLAPGAGRRYVDYQFVLNSGDYKTTYNRNEGPNPETSTITGSTYQAGFSERWTMDSLRLTQGDRPTVDIIDRVKYDIDLDCMRHEDSFNKGEGAFIVNKSGPVRALRSWVGANSGPNTQNTQAFYDTSIEAKVDLRVHLIPNVGAHIDFNREAFGMSFRNPQAPNGLAIDGQPDTLAPGAPSWFTVSGSQGALAASVRYQTNATSTAPTTHFEDDLTPGATAQCTGDDDEAVGDAGAYFRSVIECTDPGWWCTPTLSYSLRTVAKPASTDAATIRSIAERNLKPLTATVTARR